MEQQNKPVPQKRKADHYIGLFLVVFGLVRLYNIYFKQAEYSTLRTILTFGFVGYGCYNLYKYFVLSNKN